MASREKDAVPCEILHKHGTRLPRRAGHVFCSPVCRLRGESPERFPVDRAAVERLFDPARDPDERVRPDDWHATPHLPKIVALDRHDTVARRRRWFRNPGSKEVQLPGQADLKRVQLTVASGADGWQRPARGLAWGER